MFGGFLNSGYPQIIYASRIFPYKPSILGYAHLWKPHLCKLHYITAANVHSSVDPFNPMWVCPIPQSRNSSPKFIGRRYSTAGEAMYWLHAQPRTWISSFYCKFASMKICSPNLALVARFATVGHSSRQLGLKFLRSCMRSHLNCGFIGMVWWFSWLATGFEWSLYGGWYDFN